MKNCSLTCLPKELLLKIISSVAIEPNRLFPISLIELSKCCKYLHFLIHKDTWRLQFLWPRAFHYRFDTAAIYRRRLNYKLNWQHLYERRCKALYQCRTFHNTNQLQLLNTIDWEVIWDMITEHDQYNIPHLLNYKVEYAAGIAFQLGPFRDREVYPVVLPILSLLVNYDFSITRFFHTNEAIVSNELSQFAYNFEVDSLITQHTPFRMHHQEPPTHFYPSQDPLSSAFHLFFTTIFAHHPNIYQAVPDCLPIPLSPLNSELFDVEFLRRYERNLFFASLKESKQGWEIKQHGSSLPTSSSIALHNIYADTGFASPSHFVSEAHLIEGDWIGYYTFQDVDDDNVPTVLTASNTQDWFDGPMRISIKIVPLEDASGEPITQSSWLSRWLDDEDDTNENDTTARKRRKTNNNNLVTTIQNASKYNKHKKNQFPSKHLKTCPLTRFEGTGVDNLGSFSITGLVDDTEDGQITWEKNYIDSGETWEYSGRFVWPMGLTGRWGDEEYGGPWWMWKTSK